MELSKRLQAVADLLDYHEAVADIGCDHGYVSIYLIESKKAGKCIAMDVNKGPLEHAMENIRQERLSTYIETRLSDGAKELQYRKNEGGCVFLEVQAALIAGMGGRLMIQILKDSLDKFKCMEEFVLQPQSEIPKVRQFIREIGCSIVKENMILEDGKYYPMMKVIRSQTFNTEETKISSDLKKKLDENKVSLQDMYDEYGEYLLKQKNQVLYEFLKYENSLYHEILKNLKNTGTKKSVTRQREIEQKLVYIALGLEWFDEM